MCELLRIRSEYSGCPWRAEHEMSRSNDFHDAGGCRVGINRSLSGKLSLPFLSGERIFLLVQISHGVLMGYFL